MHCIPEFLLNKCIIYCALKPPLTFVIADIIISYRLRYKFYSLEEMRNKSIFKSIELKIYS